MTSLLLRAEDTGDLLTCRNRHKEADQMRRQRNQSQIKKQDKATTRDLSETNMKIMPGRKFKAMLIMMFAGLE